MKKSSIILAMAALAFGMASCSQESDPKYQVPTEFTIATPALQNQEFETSTEMTDAATFNLFCSQPDYGYSAICNYYAIVSLDPECPFDRVVDEETGAVTISPIAGKSAKLENLNPTSAAMSIKTFELGAAVNVLSGITSQEEFDQSDLANNTVKCYFRAVCEIPSISNSAIASSNVVSYNAVKIQYAEKKAAWIYICGDVQTTDNSVANGFLAPSTANQDVYAEYWSLFEPSDKIGEKLYVGQFNLTPKSATPNLEDVNDCSQFRFFTELGGWVNTYSLASAEADFYCLPISDKFAAGYSGDIVTPGLGNWGVWVSEPTPMTVVVDQLNLKVYVKEGLHEVTFLGRDPEFN